MDPDRTLKLSQRVMESDFDGVRRYLWLFTYDRIDITKMYADRNLASQNLSGPSDNRRLKILYAKIVGRLVEILQILSHFLFEQ